MSYDRPVTERALIYLRPEDDATDRSSTAGQKWQILLKSIGKQPGFVAGLWGHRLGGQPICEHIVDWDSLASHEKVDTDASVIDPLLELLDPIMPTAPHMYHIAYTDPKTRDPVSLYKLLEPTPKITEFSLFSLVSGASQDSLEDATCHFLEDFVKKAIGFVCGGYGWVLEGMDLQNIAKAEGHSKTIALTTGWSSQEALQKFRKSEGDQKWANISKGLVDQTQTDLLYLHRQ